MALRSYSRIGARLSVLDFTAVGSTLSVRSFVKCGSDVLVTGKLELANSDTYINYASNALSWYVSNNRALSYSTGGGTLHGLWYSDNDMGGTASDRRLKENIQPLFQSVQEAGSSLLTNRWKPGSDKTLPDRSLNWLLKELRPVSYKLNKEDKQRFGFIADEMAKAIPEVVRTNKRGFSGIMYEYLIAFLTNAMQKLKEDHDKLLPRLVAVEGRIQQRKNWNRLKKARKQYGLANH